MTIPRLILSGIFLVCLAGYGCVKTSKVQPFVPAPGVKTAPDNYVKSVIDTSAHLIGAWTAVSGKVSWYDVNGVLLSGDAVPPAYIGNFTFIDTLKFNQFLTSSTIPGVYFINKDANNTYINMATAFPNGGNEGYIKFDIDTLQQHKLVMSQLVKFPAGNPLTINGQSTTAYELYERFLFSR